MKFIIASVAVLAAVSSAHFHGPHFGVLEAFRNRGPGFRESGILRLKGIGHGGIHGLHFGHDVTPLGQGVSDWASLLPHNNGFGGSGGHLGFFPFQTHYPVTDGPRPVLQGLSALDSVLSHNNGDGGHWGLFPGLHHTQSQGFDGPRPVLQGLSALASVLSHHNGNGGSGGHLGLFPGLLQSQGTGFQAPFPSGWGNGFGDGGQQNAAGSSSSHLNFLGNADGSSGVTDWNSPASDWTHASPLGNDYADHQGSWPLGTHSHDDGNTATGLIGNSHADGLLSDVIGTSGQGLGHNIQTATPVPVVPVQPSPASNSVLATQTQSSSSAAADSTGNAGATAQTQAASASTATAATAGSAGSAAAKTITISVAESNGQSQGSSGASSSAASAQASTSASAGQSTSASTSAGSQ